VVDLRDGFSKHGGASGVPVSTRSARKRRFTLKPGVGEVIVVLKGKKGVTLQVKAGEGSMEGGMRIRKNAGRLSERGRDLPSKETRGITG